MGFKKGIEKCVECEKKMSENPDEKSKLMIKLGKCKIPTCTCLQFMNPIQEIDEDLL